jgi:hypothetical protein
MPSNESHTWPTLSDALEKFNRKDRNLAVRYILDHVKKPPPLGEKFLNEVSQKLSLASEAIWWATDFQIS